MDSNNAFFAEFDDVAIQELVDDVMPMMTPNKRSKILQQIEYERVECHKNILSLKQQIVEADLFELSVTRQNVQCKNKCIHSLLSSDGEPVFTHLLHAKNPIKDKWKRRIDKAPSNFLVKIAEIDDLIEFYHENTCTKCRCVVMNIVSINSLYKARKACKNKHYRKMISCQQRRYDPLDDLRCSCDLATPCLSTTLDGS